MSSSQEIWEECRMKMKIALRREITTQMEKKYAKKITALEEEIMKLKSEQNKKDEKDRDHLDSLPKPEKSTTVPFILSPDYTIPLALVVSKMEINTFLRFIRTSKKTYQLAQTGAFRIPLKLSVHLFDMNALTHVSSSHPGPFLLYRNRFLKAVDLYNIRKFECFSVEVDKLDARSCESVRECVALFKLVGVQKIDSVFLLEKSTKLFHDILQTFEIGRLEFTHIPVILRSPPPRLLQLKELRITSAPAATSDEQMNIVKDFVLRSTITSFHFFGSLPTTFASMLLELWISRERNWESIVFQVDVSDISPQAMISDFTKKMKLRTFSCRDNNGSYRNFQSDVVPALIKENHHTFLLIRDDNAKIVVSFAKEYKRRGQRKFREFEVRRVM